MYLNSTFWVSKKNCDKLFFFCYVSIYVFQLFLSLKITNRICVRRWGHFFTFFFRWFRRVSNEQQKKERIKFIFNDFLSFHQTSFFIDIRCSSKYIDLVFIAYQNKAKAKASKLSKCPWMKFPSLNLSSRMQSWTTFGRCC